MKILILALIALALSFVHALLNVPTLNTFADSTVITATPFNQNFDSLKRVVNYNKDTLEGKFIRFSDITGGDTTLTLVKFDSLYGRTIKTTGAVVGNVTGNVTGNISGGTVAGSTGTFTGTVLVDSLFSTKQVRANLKGNVTSAGASTFDSVYIRTGNITGRLGIGTTSPSTMLEVSAASNVRVTASETTTPSSAQFFAANGAGWFQTKTNHPALFAVNDGSHYLKMMTTGKMGIDIASPAERFDVTGGNIKADTAKLAAVTGSAATMYITGTTIEATAPDLFLRGKTYFGAHPGSSGALDSIKVTTGGGVDTLKIWLGGDTDPFRVIK